MKSVTEATKQLCYRKRRIVYFEGGFCDQISRTPYTNLLLRFVEPTSCLREHAYVYRSTLYHWSIYGRRSFIWCTISVCRSQRDLKRIYSLECGHHRHSGRWPNLASKVVVSYLVRHDIFKIKHSVGISLLIFLVLYVTLTSLQVGIPPSETLWSAFAMMYLGIILCTSVMIFITSVLQASP